MFGWVPKNAAPFLGTRPNISETHSEISTRVPFCITVLKGAAPRRPVKSEFGYHLILVHSRKSIDASLLG